MSKVVRIEIDEALHAILLNRSKMIEDLRQEQDELARKYGTFTDSTPLIREWRDE